MNSHSIVGYRRLISTGVKMLDTAMMAAVVTICFPGLAVATAIGTVDQQNVVPTAYANGSVAPYSFGQSFTPSLPAIDAMEFWVGGTDANVIVRLRDSVVGGDGLDGVIIAESLPVQVNVPLGYKRHHFDFPSRAPLSVGQQYVAELRVTSGNLALLVQVADPYPGGQEFNEDFPALFLSNQDVVFREGLHVPEPGTALSLATLAICSFGRVRRQRAAT